MCNQLISLSSNGAVKATISGSSESSLVTHMGTILIGYDTESGTVPEATMNTFKKSISAIMKVHTEFDVPATIFLVGKTLASGVR